MTDKFNIENLNITNRTPFTVPDSYFSQLQKDVLSQLPEQQCRTVVMHPRHSQKKTLLGVAASICVAVIAVTAYWQRSAESAASDVVGYDSVITGSLSEADYIMIDNEDIYTYLSDNQL